MRPRMWWASRIIIYVREKTMNTKKIEAICHEFDIACVAFQPTPEEAVAAGSYIVKKALELEPDNTKRAALRHVVDEAMKMATDKWRKLVGS